MPIKENEKHTWVDESIDKICSFLQRGSWYWLKIHHKFTFSLHIFFWKHKKLYQSRLFRKKRTCDKGSWHSVFLKPSKFSDSEIYVTHIAKMTQAFRDTPRVLF